MNEQQNQFDPVVARRNRMIFVGMALLFAAPILIATYMYKSGWRPASTMNHGTLVQPPRPAPGFVLSNLAGGSFDQQGLKNLWNLVVVTEGACSNSCKKNLHTIRQVQVAQGKNQHRVRRILVQNGNVEDLDKLATAYPKLTILGADAASLDKLRKWTATSDRPGLFDGSRVYMVDPQGNFMMYYLPGYDPTGLRKDIVRLLKVSHIG